MLTRTAPPGFAGLELIDGTWWNVYTDGTRLPLIAGGADDDDDKSGDDDHPDDDDKSGDDDPDDDDAKQLGDAGKRALDAMKGKWKTERDQRKAIIKIFTDIGFTPDEAAAELKKLKAKKPVGDDDKPDDVDADAIKEQARREARAEATLGRAVDRIEARAGRTFEIEVDGKTVKYRFDDPEDAVAFLRDKAKDFVDGDTIDNEAIDDALKELLEKKTRLGTPADGKTRKFDGDADAGARKSSDKKPANLGDAISKRYASNKA